MSNKQPQKDNKDMSEILHCRRCKTQMEGGVCPKCGYKIYVPMDRKKQEKIKLCLTVVFMVAVVVIFVVMQFKKNA